MSAIQNRLMEFVIFCNPDRPGPARNVHAITISCNGDVPCRGIRPTVAKTVKASTVPKEAQAKIYQQFSSLVKDI
jgi:hypothetical protein